MTLRFFIAIMLVIVIAGIVTYFLIPSPLKVSGRTVLHTNINGSYRVLTKQEVWDKFSPGDFSVKKKLINAVELDLKSKSYQIPVSLLLIPLSKDSVAVSWSTAFPKVYNPISKIRQYGRAEAVKQQVSSTLQNFQDFVRRTENVYGFHIEEKSTTDTFLITTRFTSIKPPSNHLIYSYVNKLQSYAAASGAKQVSAPMLNVSTADSSRFSCMVAIPISNKVENADSISFVRMVPGRFLTAQIQGGPHSIRNAHKTMSQYFIDFNRMSMALPFEYLITNRVQETDTAKWVTKIYYPVY